MNAWCQANGIGIGKSSAEGITGPCRAKELRKNLPKLVLEPYKMLYKWLAKSRQEESSFAASLHSFLLCRFGFASVASPGGGVS